MTDKQRRRMQILITRLKGVRQRLPHATTRADRGLLSAELCHVQLELLALIEED